MEDFLPDASKVVFKEKFVERYSKLTDFDEFKKYSLTYIRKAIRVNTLKISVQKLKSRLSNWKLEQVPWCSEGFWIKGERWDIGNILEHQLGYFYVQEAASMIPPVVLDPKEYEIILDRAAAPGSKTTQIAQYMKNTGLLIANDVDGKRLKILGANLSKMGVLNAVITKMQQIKGIEFDRILVDAPCSGTGTIMKSLKTVNMWNPKSISKLSRLQKMLVASSFEVLKVGGVMVYSTCTMEPQEDEGVVDFLIRKFPNAKLEKIYLNIKKSSPITEFEGEIYSDEVNKCLRIWPQDNNTEGFFVAKIKKT